MHFIYHNVGSTFEGGIALHHLQQDPHGAEDYLAALSDFVLQVSCSNSSTRNSLA